MSETLQYSDIIILGVIALFVALRLRSMLGRGGGQDVRESWKQASRDVNPDKTAAFTERTVKKILQEEELVPPQLKGNTEIEAGLKAIKAADASFSTADFIAGAKLAFEWVVEAFAKGNKEKLRMLLSDERFVHFAADIDARAKGASIAENTLVSILAADITEALLQGTRAHITVQFTTEQIHVTRDEQSNVISGDPSAIEKVVDVWTFARDTISRDPNWKITAT